MGYIPPGEEGFLRQRGRVGDKKNGQHGIRYADEYLQDDEQLAKTDLVDTETLGRKGLI